MKITTRTSSPLRPIASYARALSESCDELWVATAFVSDAALNDVVATALQNGASVRFVTGTFGNVTRHRTFKRLWTWSQKQKLEARVWAGDFHAKLALWRIGSSAHCWIGSANLTDRGLQAEGELVAELVGPWAGRTIQAFSHAFLAEWQRAEQLDAAFLKRYREAPRASGLLHGKSMAPHRSPKAHRKRTRTNDALVVLPVSRYFADDGPVVKRISAQLDGTADSWYRSNAPSARSIGPGQWCLVADSIAESLDLAIATDTLRDGKGRVIAYQLASARSSRPMDRKCRTALRKLGLKPTSTSFRMQWLGDEAALTLVEAVFGKKLRSALAADLA
jgi:HKD family nuclease